MQKCPWVRIKKKQNVNRLLLLNQSGEASSQSVEREMFEKIVSVIGEAGIWDVLSVSYITKYFKTSSLKQQ